MRPIIMLVVGLICACAASPAQADLRWRTVLVAGDGSLPVWDNAIAQFRQRVVRSAGPHVTVFSADPTRIAAGARPATAEAILKTIRTLAPAEGEGCLVYATAHGSPRVGLALPLQREYLSPEALDRALADGCGEAPTVVIMSACYSGSFAQGPMARPNRIILTAARPDRSSFGCGAGFTYTVFDECLLGALADGPWRAVAAATHACVARRESELRVSPPSEPMFHEGAGVRSRGTRFGAAAFGG
jgi:hypothetical protein